MLLSDADWPLTWDELSVDEHWEVLKKDYSYNNLGYRIFSQNTAQKKVIMAEERHATYSASKAEGLVYVARIQESDRPRRTHRTQEPMHSRLTWPKTPGKPLKLVPIHVGKKPTNQWACALVGSNSQYLTSLEMAETFSLAFSKQLMSNLGITGMDQNGDTTISQEEYLVAALNKTGSTTREATVTRTWEVPRL
ncbi:unnamed protein product [Trichobilharzia regenti]|nr:unnamed protein product [Trichobilharzia regenti]